MIRSVCTDFLFFNNFPQNAQTAVLNEIKRLVHEFCYFVVCVCSFDEKNISKKVDNR